MGQKPSPYSNTASATTFAYTPTPTRTFTAAPTKTSTVVPTKTPTRVWTNTPSSLASNTPTRTATPTDKTAPSVPTGLTASAVSCSQINLSWTASTDTGGSGLKGYNVYRNGGFLKLVLAPATSTADTGLAASTIYSYTVTAVDNAGNQSGQSSTASTNTPACATTSTPTPTATPIPIASTGSNAALVGFIPGVATAKDVVVNATTGLAYVASWEFGLSVVNVSTPSKPVVIGGANPAFYGERVAVSGSLAVVTGGTQGLRVVDVSIPSAPKTLGALSGTMPGVAMAGQYAYVLLIVPGNPAHTDLVVVNLGVPSSPVIVGRVTLAGGADIKVVGSLAYVAAGAAGLQIVNVSNPVAPVIVGTRDTPGTANGVSVANGYAYVADGTSVQVINVSTPSNPTIVGSLAMTSATAVAVLNTKLYVVDYTYFKVVDVSNPAAPVRVSTSNSVGAQRVAAAGTWAYLANPQGDGATKTAGLYVWDVSSPTSPQILATVYTAYDNSGMAVAGSLAVVTATNNLGLKVVDVSVPSAPKNLGSLSGSTMVGVAMAGQYAYALQVVPGNPAHTDLVSVSLTTPTTPVIVGRVTLAGGADIKVAGSLAYVAVGAAGLQIVNVGNPVAPVIVGTRDTPGTASGVAVANGYAYVADGTSVQVINVSTPNSPVIVGSLAMTAATAVAVANTKLYVIDGSTQFKIVDVSNPAAPALLSASSNYAAQRVDAMGTLAFLAKPAATHVDSTGGLYVLDASNALQPQLLKQVVVPGTIHTVAATTTLVYTGDSAAIVNVINPTL